MATIRTLCPEHGGVELSTADVVLIGMATFRFRCPNGCEITKPCQPRTAELLLSAGVQQFADIASARFPDRDKLTEEEIAEFRRLLGRRRLIARYAEGGAA